MKPDVLPQLNPLREEGKESRYNAEIEVLRGFAVAVTFAGHLSLLYGWNATDYPKIHEHLAFWGGVDLFFAISGFVIARSLLGSVEGASTPTAYWRGIGGFWIRRVFRIIPSAWLWLAIGILLTVVFNSSKAFGYFWTNVYDALAAIFQVFNFYFLACMQGRAKCGHVFDVYWSLSLEEQFYIALPLILYWCPPRHLAKLLAAVVLVQFPIERPLWSLGWAVRTDAISLGVLIALFSRTKTYEALRPSGLRYGPARWTVAGILLTGVLVIPQAFRPLPFSTGMLAVVSGILVWIASYEGSYFMRDGIWRKVWTWLGSRSYAIYLVHVPMLLSVREVWARLAGHGMSDGIPPWVYGICACALTAVSADLNYRWVERPLRARGRALARAFTVTVPPGGVAEDKSK